MSKYAGIVQGLLRKSCTIPTALATPGVFCMWFGDYFIAPQIDS